MEFMLNSSLAAQWAADSNYLCYLSVQDEEALEAFMRSAQEAGIPCYPFYEPDVGDALTAVALEPTLASQHHTKGMSLALKKVKE